MIRIEDVDGNVVTMAVTADADAAEMRAGYERVESLMDEYETVHVLERVTLSGTDFLGMRSKAAADVRRGGNVDLGRVAVVGGGRTMRLLTAVWKAVRPVVDLSPDELRHFEAGREDDARAWLDRRE